MIIEQIEQLLTKFKRDGYDDSYLSTIYDENGIDEYDLFKEIDKLFKGTGLQYEVTECGSFDSPGYAMYAYCLSWIDEHNRLQTLPIMEEIR